MPLIGGHKFAMSHIICDVGIVIVFVVLRNPVSWLDAKYEIALFKNKNGTATCVREYTPGGHMTSRTVESMSPDRGALVR